MKSSAPNLFTKERPVIEYIPNSAPIPGHIIYDNGYYCRCGCAYAKVSSYRTHLFESKLNSSRIDALVISNKATVMKKFDGGFIVVVIPQLGVAEEKDGDNIEVGEGLKQSLMDCFSDSLLPDYSNEIIIRTFQDDLNQSPFYALSHIKMLDYIEDAVKLKSLFKSVKLTKQLDRSPVELAMDKLSSSFIIGINEASKNHTNGVISLQIQNSDRGFSSSLDQDGTGLNETISNRQNRFRYNYFTPVRNIAEYKATIHKLLKMLFYFSSNDLTIEERIVIPQLQSLSEDITRLRASISILSNNLNNTDNLNSAMFLIKDLLYKSISTEFSLTDPYTKTLYHHFMFGLHLEEKNAVIRCGKIGYLTKYAAHILFAIKGVVLLKQIDKDTLGDAENLIGNPLIRLECSSSRKLRVFAFMINFFKLAQVYSQNEKSDLNKLIILRDENGKLDFKKLSIRDVVIHFDKFVEGNQKLLKGLYELVDEILFDFKIHATHTAVDGDRYGILKLLRDDFNNQVSFIMYYSITFI